MISFQPAGKRKKPTLPPKDKWGHIQWIRSVPYHALMDSSGYITKGDIISDTDNNIRSNEDKSDMLHRSSGQSIEEWTYDEYEDQIEYAKFHANGKLYNRITHNYFENGDVKEVIDSTFPSHGSTLSVRIEQYTYVYNNSDKLITSNKWNYYVTNRNHPNFTRIVNTYNPKGKLDEKMIYNTDTINPASGIYYKYNDNGKLIEEEERTKQVNIPDLAPDTKKDFWYDEKGRIKDSATYRAHEGLVKDTKITIDSLGKKLEIYSYGQHQVLTGTVVKTYFKESNTQQEDTYDPDGFLTEYSISHYDSAKHLLDKGVFHISYKRTMGQDRQYHNEGPGDTVMVHHIINDDHFNTVEDDTFSNNGKTISHKSYQYTYDSVGNWIDKIEFNDNKPVKIIEREIGYFKD